MAKKLITALIPTLTNTAGLHKVISAIRPHCKTIIVDNQPSDEKSKLAGVDILYLPQAQNQGFARGVNLAASRASTPWLLILNDDIEFPNSSIIPDLLAYAKDKKLNATSPLLLKPGGVVENYGYHVEPRGKVTLLLKPGGKVDGMTAACLLIQRSLFLKLGGFDERFFAYLEDVDLFLRMQKLGAKYMSCEHISVLHNHMTTSGKMGNFKSKMDLKNWIFIGFKHPPSLIHLPSFLVERGRNLSGYLKATWKASRRSFLMNVVKDLTWLAYSIITFPLKPASSIKNHGVNDRILSNE